MWLKCCNTTFALYSYRNEFVMDMCEWRDQVCYIFKTEVYLNLRIFSSNILKWYYLWKLQYCILDSSQCIASETTSVIYCLIFPLMSSPFPFLVSVFILCERVKSWANGPHSCLESIFTSYKSSACSGILSTPSDSEALSIKGDFPFWDGRIPYLPILVFLPSYCHTTFEI